MKVVRPAPAAVRSPQRDARRPAVIPGPSTLAPRAWEAGLRRAFGNHGYGQLLRMSAGATDAGTAGDGIIQRKCTTCAADEEEPAVQRLGIQPKLSISRPGDVHEREADAVADRLVERLALPATPGVAAEDVPDVQRVCDECKIASPSPEELEADREDEAVPPSSGTVSPEAEPGATSAPPPPGLESSLAATHGGGQPLPPPLRDRMEQGFGQDFGHVRIHTGERSIAMNRAIRAKAFTHRSDIHFNRGQFDPATPTGQRLLAHELTHVVQQTGARAIRPQIQRAVLGGSEAKIGNWAHFRIQNALREGDKKLITEAPIPGGTRDEKRINVVGFADFYKAEKQTVSGISAQEPQESKEFADRSKAFYKYVNMRRDWLAKAKSRSGVRRGPRIVSHARDTWDFNPTFPSNFHVGELKPLFPTEFPRSFVYHGTAATAWNQLGNYRQGFEEFVGRVYRDKPKHRAKLPAKITGRPLNIPDSSIPDAINYRQFEKEHGRTTGKDVIAKRDKDPKQRIWMYRLKDGIYVYFLLPLDYKSKEFPARVEQQLQVLDPLLARLRQKRPKMGAKLDTKPESGPRAGRRESPPPVRDRRAPAIQRKEDWKKAGKAWEDARQIWVRGGVTDQKPKEFLKKQGRGVLKKSKADKKLGLRPTGRAAKAAKSVRRIRFWSGFRGRILGALRFRFARVFNRVEEFFDKLKQKFRKHRTKSDALVSKNGIFSGWKKVATRAIIRFAVEIFKEMLGIAFRGFMNCINGIVGAILGKFNWVVEEAREEITKEIEPVCCEVMEFKDRVEKEYEEHEATIATFTETVEKIGEWRRILDQVETAIRIGVQAISCGTPPALGCLWGLVAQLGISAGLSLLARTDYFDEEIARPAARGLMNAIVGDSLHNFLIQLLESTPLKPFLDEAADCRKRTGVIGRTAIGGNLHKLDPNAPDNAAARAAWEKEYADEILRDLQKVFEKGKGRKVTRKDLEKLVEQLGGSGRTPEELKQMLEAARNPATGRLSIEKAAGYVERDEMPEAEAKTKAEERDIDYDKATRSNLKLQKILGWDPYTFYPKPGIAADSVEFADFVYDMQKALKIETDGILGEKTLIRFYDRNKLKKDRAYAEAIRVRDEKRAAKEKAAKAKAEKAKAAKGKGGETGGDGGLVTIPVTRPEPGMRVVGRDPDYLASYPGWISVPFAEVEPAKSSYEPGERLRLTVLHWYTRELVREGDDMGRSRWIWLPEVSGVFVSLTTSSEGHRTLTVRIREEQYFRLTPDSNTVAVETKGLHAVRLDWGALP